MSAAQISARINELNRLKNEDLELLKKIKEAMANVSNAQTSFRECNVSYSGDGTPIYGNSFKYVASNENMDTYWKVEGTANGGEAREQVQNALLAIADEFEDNSVVNSAVGSVMGAAGEKIAELETNIANYESEIASLEQELQNLNEES